MKWWFNTVAVGVSVLLAVGGCHGAEKEVQKPMDEPAKMSVAADKEAAPVESAATAAMPAPVPVPAPAQEASGPQPKVKFENTLVDIGNIKPESKNDANFVFTNVGQGKLTIIDFQTTCGCTVPELAKRDYAPGESGTVRVQYHASKQGGPILKHLFVMTNDPNNPRVEITIKAAIVVPVEIKPTSAQFLLDMPDANAPTVIIYSKDDKPFSIKSIDSHNNVVTAQIDPNKSAVRFEIKLKVDIDKLRSNPAGIVRFNITHPDIDVVNMSYTTLAEFEVQPPSLIMRSAVPKESEEREIWVKNNYNKPFEIESVSSKNGYIKVLKQEKIDNMYKLMIQITPPEMQKLMFFNDTLVINVKNAQPIDVVCRGFFRRINIGERHQVK
jgi:hypothetical protein